MELSKQSVEPRGSVDEIDFIDGLPGLVRHRAPQVAALSAPFGVRGWALDVGNLRLGEELAFEIGPNRTIADFDEERPDIANAFRSGTLTACGFRVGVPTAGLPPGQYDLRAYVRFAKDDTWHGFASAVVYIAAEKAGAPALSRGEIERGRVEVRGGIDTIDDLGTSRSAGHQAPFAVVRGTAVVVRGWAFHPEEPILGVRARFGEQVISGSIGFPRHDVAAMVGRADAATSGFIVPIRLGTTPPGAYQLAIECLTASGWLGLAGSRTIGVLTEPDPFPVEARLLSEPLRATVDLGDGAIELGTPIRLAGMIQTPNFADAYLEVSDTTSTRNSEPTVRYFPLSYPIHIDGEPTFSLELTGREFKRGRYVARIVATTLDRRAYRATGQRIRFEIIAPRRR